MAINNFKPFAIGAGANVLSQADYEALAALSSGFQAGKASSAQINKVLRQSAIMASMLAQFIADSSGNDVLDNGNTAAILANLKAGLLSASPGRLLGCRVIASSGVYTPSAGTKSIIVEVQGAGGGGGGVGATSSSTVAVASGGSGGAYAKSYISNLAASYTVTIGAPGAGGVNGPGGNAGSTSFGSVITCGGGFGGGSGTSAPPIIQNSTGIPTASGGNIENISGQGAVIGMAISLNAIISGGGGGSPLGSGGGSHGTAQAGFPASGYGAGGGGANAYASNSTQYNGAAGSNGVVIVWEYS